MAFNWFRRQENSSNTPEQQSQGETQSSETAQPEAAPEPAIDTADMLAFAKAAYKNIQQKQQATETEDVPQPETEPTPEVVTEAVTAETTTDTTPETPTPELEVSAVTEEPAPVETVVEATKEAENQDVVTPTQAPATLSFLERAAAEREAKQERLIANAIDVAQPEVETIEPVAVSPETSVAEADVAEADVEEVAFDEGFVWSTEVLAAQGRKAEDISIEEINWLKKLRQGLDKTRRNFLNQLKAVVGQGPLNQAAVTEIEALLLQADVGVEATDLIITALQKKLRDEVTPPEQAIAYLKEIIRDMLDQPIKASSKVNFAPTKDTLNIWLITGVNGAGKTTTIGKLAHLAQKSGYKCLIGAADTFRAAAVEQVKVWGSRSGVEVIANPGKNTDPAAVVFDAITAAQSRQTELLLVDTAGRLQNKKNLMDELSKVRKIIDKKAPDAHIESLLVLDATLGQNGLRQAEVFSQAAQLSGVVLTKLDGTAKGGVALAVVQQLGLPIRFIGAGEGIEDLRPFSSYEFTEALLSG
ncbi:cell division protein [Richelia sinica FACHB-800]|uniref:Signal recognition particle receptor FtsY n=1 Tax=Richelia sinica FACHB-800 TaxID=1357546 RepID=A0A975T7F1_9NOST|nr:signal recognition particle-docking protein FtsY [Richelia sinica]MBD2663656.1 signal recognition particle-docking protein FtsY [Richelia sinica FACHB-800]QXE22781.1 cell division protein [Richelia sinica FACHB-800]